MITKVLVAASSKPLILSILKQGENYGYQIIQNISEVSGGEMSWSDGMLYPVLHRLEKDGLILSEWKLSDNGRMRKYYNITDSGLKELETERQQWLSVHKTLLKSWEPLPALD